MKYLNRLTTLLSIFMIGGCLAGRAAPDGVRHIDIETLHSSPFCGRSQHMPSSIWITSQNQLALIWKGLHSTLIGGTPPVAPRVDFTTHNLLLINMGIQRSGGYSLELAKKTAPIEGHAAIVQINWIKPDKGAFVTQVITSPCLLIKIKRGPYHTINIRDQFNRLRITLNKP